MFGRKGYLCHPMNCTHSKKLGLKAFSWLLAMVVVLSAFARVSLANPLTLHNYVGVTAGSAVLQKTDSRKNHKKGGSESDTPTSSDANSAELHQAQTFSGTGITLPPLTLEGIVPLTQFVLRVVPTSSKLQSVAPISLPQKLCSMMVGNSIMTQAP